MVFKLVRVDSENACKIQLPPGKHLFGRGKFLNCDDKRISRNHGELEVLDDAVIIKALHQNPCFILKKETEDTQILKLNSTVNVSNGDRFGLLPDSYWYELLHCTATDTNEGTASDIPELNKEIFNAQTQPLENDNESQEIDFNMTDKSENERDGVQDSPSLISNEYADDCSTDTNDENQNYSDGSKSPLKRAHNSPDDNSEDVKKIKSEIEEVKQEPADDDQCDDAVAGPSNDQPVSANSDDNDKNSPSPAPAQNPQRRERCMYGANCYRRNQQHKAQFSHPADADWGQGDRGSCPWGAACRRRDPRHWLDNTHPPSARPPNNNQGNKKRKPKKRYSSNEDEDDDDDVLTPVQIDLGKRTRKVVNRNNQWDGLSESENDEDPYKTDESDEWQPSND